MRGRNDIPCRTLSGTERLSAHSVADAMRSDGERDDRPHARATAALLGVVPVVIITNLGQRVSDRFGDSHTGSNVSVLAPAADAIRTEGLFRLQPATDLTNPPNNSTQHTPPTL